MTSQLPDETPAAPKAAPTAAKATVAAPQAAKPAPKPELELPAAPSGGRTAATWAALIVGAIVMILLLIFIVQNNTPATFTYFNYGFELPLGVAMLLAAIAGALVMALVGSVRMFQMRRQLRKIRKYQEKLVNSAH
ncbi:LapA family protein [Dermabacteraceae bacterium P13128]